MKNPWEEISLSDYENHMSLESVKQLQTMNDIMKAQFGDYNVNTACVFGIAGGNGLEHVDTAKYKKVYGIDVNADYLEAVQQRYNNLIDILECRQLNLIEEADKLPNAELVIANLLIEYIGYEIFAKAVQYVMPKYISCVIQINSDEQTWISDSPYLHAFDRLDEVHHQMEGKVLTETMSAIGYKCIRNQAYPLPNGKSLMRLDYGK